jgi:hypothetical protein
LLARRGAAKEWDGFFHKPFEVRAVLAAISTGTSRGEGGEDRGPI